MTQANTNQPDNKAMGAIMQRQIDTLQCTVQCLTTQRNATSDALTSAQTSVMMKDRQINSMNEQLNSLSEQLGKAKAQSELWNGRYNEMAIQKSALVWFIEQLLIEIPDSKIQTVSPEIISSVVESYNDHLRGEKLKSNALRYTEILAAKVAGEEVEPEPNNPDDADAEKSPGNNPDDADAEKSPGNEPEVNIDAETKPAEPESESEPVIELKTSLVKSNRPKDVSVETTSAKPGLAEQAQRKIKGQDRASNS